MQIQPIQPVSVVLKNDDLQMVCHLIELNDNEMYLNTDEFVETDITVRFQSPFFWGQALVVAVSYVKSHFKLTLRIQSIKFQPGLLINMKL